MRTIMVHSQLSDKELIAACLAGDMPGWDEMIARYSRFIYALVLRMGLSSNDADDVFQNVCVRLYQNLAGLRDAERLSTWLAVTTRHEVWSWNRMRRQTTTISEISDRAWEIEGAQKVAGSADVDPEENAIALATQDLVRQSLQHLSGECRELLTLLYAEDPPCSYIEVAQRLGMPMGSIGPKRARCLNRLEKLLQKFGY